MFLLRGGEMDGGCGALNCPADIKATSILINGNL